MFFFIREEFKFFNFFIEESEQPDRQGQRTAHIQLPASKPYSWIVSLSDTKVEVAHHVKR